MENKKSISKLKGVLKFVFSLGIGGGLLYWAFQNQDFSQVWQDIKGANLFWIGVSLFCAFIAFVSRAYRWACLIEPISHSPNIFNTYNSLVLGYLANLIFPRLGEVTRCTVLYKKEKLPLEALLGTVVAERLIDLICLVIVIVMIFFTQVELFSEFFAQYIYPSLKPILNNTVFIAISGTIGVILLLFYVKYRKRIDVALAQSRIGNIIANILSGLKSVFKIKHKKLFFLHTLIIWLMYYLMTYVVFFALPETANLSWNDGLFIMAVGGIGMSMPVQGGVGAYHKLVTVGMVLLGTTEKSGLTFATLVHSTQTLLVIFLGVTSYFMLWVGRKK